MPIITHTSDGCNGWALYEGQYIQGAQPRNIHIVETVVVRDENGMARSRPNSDLVTMCGPQHLVTSSRSCLLATTNENEIRNEIARLQNSGHEVCGQCAARFYADPEDAGTDNGNG